MTPFDVRVGEVRALALWAAPIPARRTSRNDRRARVAADDVDLHVAHVLALVLGHERIGTDDVERRHPNQLVLVQSTPCFFSVSAKMGTVLLTCVFVRDAARRDLRRSRRWRQHTRRIAEARRATASSWSHEDAIAADRASSTAFPLPRRRPGWR